MKKKMFLLNACLAISIQVLISCSNDMNSYKDEIVGNEKELNLRAPSGEYLAKDIETLKEMLSPIIESGYEENKDFEILSIQYDPLVIGFVANIEYRTNDEIESNIIVNKTENTSVRRFKTRREDNSGGGLEYYNCRKANNKKCSSCRVVDDKKNNQVRCACDNGLVEGCELYVTKY